jgi:hypothetical protein
MKKRRLVGLAAAALILSLPWTAGRAGAQDRDEEENQPVSWKAIEGATVTLEQGLAAAPGRAISAKFEIDEGRFQLSVYTSRDGKLWEVTVDHATGKVTKTEEIKGGEDLEEATAQDKAMAKAKGSLGDAIRKALASNPGHRAVSVVPALDNGHPVATVTPMNASSTKTVKEKLD